MQTITVGVQRKLKAVFRLGCGIDDPALSVMSYTLSPRRERV
jgi:hypothetical protein